MVKKVYRKKRGYKKRGYKKTYVPRPQRSLQLVHKFKRMYSVGDVFKTASSTPYLNAFDFSLQDLPAYSEFTALFDFYKICAVKFIFVPGWTQSEVNVNTGAPVSAQINLGAARCFSAIDYNDSSSPSTINEIREYGNCKWSPMVKGHKRYFKPRAMDSSNSYNINKNTWIDTSLPNKPYYGIKFGIDFNSYSFLSTTNIGKIEAVIYFKCKSVR